MGVRIAYLAASMAVLAGVAACAFNPYSEPRGAWRGEAEAECIARREARPSAFAQPMPPLSGRGSCGLEHPFKVSATLNGSVAVDPPATLDCPMTAAIDRWMKDSVQPAAQAYFRERVIAIRQIASYGCRTRDNIDGAKLSEHAFGNALDVAGFRLADGREIGVAQGWWHGGPQEQAFLQAAFAGACAEFYTLLGPGSDGYHSNHFHLDLLRSNTGGGRHYCRPQPARQPYGPVPVAELPIDIVGIVAKAPLSFTGKAP